MTGWESSGLLIYVLILWLMKSGFLFDRRLVGLSLSCSRITDSSIRYFYSCICVLDIQELYSLDWLGLFSIF